MLGQIIVLCSYKGFNISDNLQLEYFLNTLVYAFSEDADVTRRVSNNLPNGVTANSNAISYNSADTFQVIIKCRNLTNQAISDLEINEDIKEYFTLFEIDSDESFVFDTANNVLTFQEVSLPAFSEKEIIYNLITPSAEDSIHTEVNDFISWSTYIYPSYSTINYTSENGFHKYYNYRNFADLMFSAEVVADADFTEDNHYLKYGYAPYTVSTHIENKERTSAMSSIYTQFIPMDVPLYNVDRSLNIPILKTPGGHYVDILRGNENSTNPIYDLDSDGHPDVWLDTASIYPKGFTVEIDSVYWINPWEHLRESDTLYFEDINHDGVHPLDTNRDGIVDIASQEDKIRVWKVIWEIEEIPAYQVYEPFCSYTLWLDVPNLYSLSSGVAYAEGTLETDLEEMFYPYTDDLNSANLSDTLWSHWMKRDENNDIEYKQLVKQTIDDQEMINYIDTASINYSPLPNDIIYGTVPVPRNEFVAVILLGGEEIDMYNPKPENSLYSNISYKTIFNEDMLSPLPTMYVHMDRGHYYDHFSFTHLTQNPKFTDQVQDIRMTTLPLYGEANLQFKIDVATEYSYYWVRNFGYDVDFNDPSYELDGVENFGDGIFGYMVYDIPKGYGDYSITLPLKEDGTYDIDSIVKIDDELFARWIDNENTGDSIEIWEDNFKYSIFIPQLLVPPAMDDDNFDGINDWIDDRGDRFYNHNNQEDRFMLGNGASYPDYPEVPFTDPVYGLVTSGWYPGADETYGDDDYEQLGKTEITINAVYNGNGHEGPVELSKGGWLALESLNGGSPYTVFSHAINGYAQGVNPQIYSYATPSVTHFGIDTTYIRHHIYDANEPHTFDSKFDPYFAAYGYENAAAKIYVGGNDPCSLIEPDITMSAIIDPEYRHTTVTLIPNADPENPVLEDYPMEVEGVFVELKIDLTNSSDYFWKDINIETLIGNNLGETEIVMDYFAIPRPLLPNEDINTFSAAWNGENTEGEVLLTLGNQIPILESYRRAYYVVLLKVDENLEKGVYDIAFDFTATEEDYAQTHSEDITFEIPKASFSISARDDAGNITEYQRFIIGQQDLNSLIVEISPDFEPTEDARWADYNLNETHFDTIPTLSTSYKGETEEIKLSSFKNFPNLDTLNIFILEQGVVNTYKEPNYTYLSEYQTLNYDYLGENDDKVVNRNIAVSAIGPQLKVEKRISKINKTSYPFSASKVNVYDILEVETEIKIYSVGNDMATDVVVDLYRTSDFIIDKNSLPVGVTLTDETIIIEAGDFLPGEIKTYYLTFIPNNKEATTVEPSNILFTGSITNYLGALDNFEYEISDKEILEVMVSELIANNMYFVNNEITTSANQIVYNVNISNYVMESKEVLITSYAVVNKDTVHVGKSHHNFNKGETKEVGFNYYVPRGTYYLELIVIIDENKEIVEFSKSNNTIKTKVVLDDVKPEIIEIYNYPNPFKDNTTINYFVKGEFSELDVSIYDTKGKYISQYSSSAEMGQNKLDLNGLHYQTGTYIYLIKATRPDGSIQKYDGKLIKE